MPRSVAIWRKRGPTLRSVPNQSCCPNEYRSVVVDVVAAEERFRDEVGVERRLELIGEVAVGDPAKDLAIGIGDPRVPDAPRKRRSPTVSSPMVPRPFWPQARLERDLSFAAAQVPSKPTA